jgi:hypothetical protein
MDTQAPDDRHDDNVVEQLKRESGGSFSVVYRALTNVAQREGVTNTTLSKDEVIKEIRRILGNINQFPKRARP